MTKKDYQKIAGALYEVHTGRVPYQGNEYGMWQATVKALADILAADSPRFDRETFVAACEDGNVGRQPRTVRRMREASKAPCAQAMGCLCAGHARGSKASEPCDTEE